MGGWVESTIWGLAVQAVQQVPGLRRQQVVADHGPGTLHPSTCTSCTRLPTLHPTCTSCTSPSLECWGVEASGRQATILLSTDFDSTKSPSQRTQST